MRSFGWTFLLSTCLAGSLQAQDSLRVPDSVRRPEKQGKGRQAPERRKYEHRKFDSTLFMENAAATQGDYLESVEKVFLLLDQVPVTLGSLTQLDDM
ncbi:MAG TPA: hypothetical protein VG052_03175, partial [Puia sp.]|nr:hypothetical protein [Puia sp.]